MSCKLSGFVPTILAGLLFTAPALAQSDGDGCWSILKYDKDGKVIGVEQGGDCDRTESTRIEKPADPKKIGPVEGEYVLISSKKIDFSLLRALEIRVVNAEAIEELGVHTAWLRIPDRSKFKKLRSKIIREMPGVLLVPNDRYVLQQGSSLWTGTTTRANDRLRQCGSGLKIGMIDGYLNVTPENLRALYVKSQSFHPEGSQPAGQDHATMIAEMLVGQGAGDKVLGLLPAADLYAANIFGDSGRGAQTSLQSVLKALQWLVRSKVTVINFSVAGRYSKGLALLMQRVASKGIVIVAPAGNFGHDASPAWPAAHEDVVAVTAVDRNERLYGDANMGDYIDVSAFGVGIVLNTSIGQRIVQGTSFATPYVTAIAALAIGRGERKIQPKKLRQALSKVSKDLGAPGKDAAFGWGMVQYRPRC